MSRLFRFFKLFFFRLSFHSFSYLVAGGMDLLLGLLLVQTLPRKHL